MRDTFVNTLLEIAKKDENVHIITGDLGFGVLKPFWEQLPNQITNVGIAEQNMTGFATGLALEGKVVFTYSIGNFPTLRTLEQIRNDAAYHNANVKIVCVGGGFVYGSLGMSHHATEDIAIMRSLPNVKVFSPCDLSEAKYITKLAYEEKGVCYLRLGRGGEEQIHSKDREFIFPRGVEIRNEGKIAILCTGSIIEEVIDASNYLKKINIKHSIYSFPIIKPMDENLIKKLAKENDHLFSVEEHNKYGGFGSAVSEIITTLNQRNCTLDIIAINDSYSSIVGTQKYLRTQYGIDSTAIIKTILNRIGYNEHG
jgi:transketolase